MKKTQLIFSIAILFISSLFLNQSRALMNSRPSARIERAKADTTTVNESRAADSPRASVKLRAADSPDASRIALRDGRELATKYIGAEIKKMLENNSAQPLSLAAGDLDGDGVPDLISGYAGDDGNMIVIHRGNVDAIYENAPEALERKARGEFTDAPFLSPAQVFALPERPDFIGTGDFDADGHTDIVVAALGSQKLYWLAGDGRGNLSEVHAVELKGKVTALTVGEMNRGTD